MVFKNVIKELNYTVAINSLKQNFISDFDTKTSDIINKSNKQHLIYDSEKQENNFDKSESTTGKKPENTNYAKIAMLLCNFFFSLSAISIKILYNYKPNYNYNLFSAIRFFVIFLLSYRLLIYKGMKIESIYKVKNWKWFILRCSSNHLALLFFTLSLTFVRMSTATCVYMTYPIFTNILSIFILNEKFSSKYLVSCLFCFIGCIAFTFSEKNSNISHSDSSAAAALAAESELNYKIILGIFFAILDGFFSSILSISTKFLMKEMNSIQSNMYIGFYLSFVCLFFALFSFGSFMSDLFDFFFLLQSTVNGFVVYGAFHFLNEAVENAELSKTSYICYTQVIFNILFGLIFFGEAFYFFDFLGFMMIIGTNVYLTFYNKSDK